jgi:hypothetical protein
VQHGGGQDLWDALSGAITQSGVVALTVQSRGTNVFCEDRPRSFGLSLRVDDAASRPAIWGYRNRASLVRIASPLRADMIFGKDTAVIAVFRALSTGRPIEPPAVRAREVSALSRPGRSLPGQNKEPS